MEAGKKIAERRKYKRYRAKEGAFAAINPNNCHRIGQIIDISMGGLAFNYIEDSDYDNGKKQKYQFEKESEYSLLLSSFDYYVEDIPFKTVEDVEVDEHISFSSIKLRKRRIKFNGLTSKQTFDLNFYLENNAIMKFE